MRFKRSILAIMVPVVLLMGAATVNGQAVPDVVNPSAFSYTPSADESAIDHYELDILRPDGTVLQTLTIAKSAPDASGTCTGSLNVQPIAFGNGYSVQLRAVAVTSSGPVDSVNVQSANKFSRVPGGPSKVKIGG